jgi:hypothetical protein
MCNRRALNIFRLYDLYVTLARMFLIFLALTLNQPPEPNILVVLDADATSCTSENVGHSHLLALAQASKLTKISKSLTPAPARKEQKYQTSILGSLQS